MVLFAGLLITLWATPHPAQTANADNSFINISCSGEHVRSVFQAVALCEPRIKIVKLPLPPNSSILQMTPRYITVARCGGGGCHGSRQICVSMASRVKTVPVLLGRCGITVGKCDKECANVEVEEDLECGCQCAVKKEDCTTLQDYNQNLCSCECHNEDLARDCQESGRIWDPSSCSCQCPVTLNKDCSTGLVFDEENTCSCVPEIGGANDILVERKERSNEDSFIGWEIIIIIVLTIIIFLFIVVTISLMKDLVRLRNKLRKIMVNSYQLYNINSPPNNTQTSPSHPVKLRKNANQQEHVQKTGSLSLADYSSNAGSVGQYGGHRRIPSYLDNEFVDSISQYSGYRNMTPYSDNDYGGYVSRHRYNGYGNIPQYHNNEYNGNMSQYGGYRIDSKYPGNEQSDFIDNQHHGNYRSTTLSHGGYRSVPPYQVYGLGKPYQGGRITPGSGYPLDSGVDSEATRSLLSESIDTPVSCVVDDHYNPIISSISRPVYYPRLDNEDTQAVRPADQICSGIVKARKRSYDANDYGLGRIEHEKFPDEIETIREVSADIEKDINIYKDKEPIQTEYVESYDDNGAKGAVVNSISDITVPDTNLSRK